MKSPFTGVAVGERPFANLNSTFSTLYHDIKPKDLPLFRQQYQTAFDALKKEKRIRGRGIR